MKSELIFSIIIEQCLILCVLIIHLSGFLNVSQVTSIDKNTHSHELESLIENQNHYKIYKNEPLGKRTVLLIIDALRTDHLVSSENHFMKYCSELLESKHGIGYMVKTASPTVTLPRIKSIVTGSIPNFLDVIFNFASKEIAEENVVIFAYWKSLKIKFFGDETWLKLYPRTFMQYDGVTSFFVSDYTEVDNNITRHLPGLLSSNDYDFLILHYLGLDHIGHLEGPKSSLIPPKLKEMDGIVKMIHKSLKDTGEPYLFLVSGDHGMSDNGGHGGDSHSEIWTSVLVMSHLFDNFASLSLGSSSPQRIRSQVDLASTLALYLGVDIPSKNVGFPFFELLEHVPIERQLVAHYRVSKQLMLLAKARQDDSELGEIQTVYEDALKQHYEAVSSNTMKTDVANKALEQYKQFELQVSSLLTENKGSYDIILLLSSSIVIIMICFPTVVWTLFLSTNISSPIYKKKMLALTISGGLILFTLSSGGFSFISPVSYIIFVLFIYGVCNLFSFARCFTAGFELEISLWSIPQVLIVVGVILNPFSLLATSFVEEEHFAYYFIVSMIYFTLLMTIILKAIRWNSETTNPKKKDKTLNSRSNILKLDYPMSVPSLYNAPLSLHFIIHRKKEVESVLSAGSNETHFKSNFLVIIVCWCIFRLLRSFNATGDKWKNLIYLNDLLRESRGNELLICVLIGLGIILLLYKQYSIIFVSLAILGIFGRHFPILDNGIKGGLLESQFVYLCLFIFIFYKAIKVFHFNRIYIKKHIYDTPVLGPGLVLYMLQVFEVFFTLLFLLLQKPENVLVTALSLLHFHLLFPLLIRSCDELGLPRMQVYIFALWIGQASFFIHGNSNSLSTVQINSGFVGIGSYYPILHGILIACHTFGSRFLVFLHILVVDLTYQKNIVRLYECIRCWWMIQLLTLTVYVISVTLQRHHLFIWSVFAPKLLYEECHFLCLMVLTIIVYLFIKLASFVSQ